MCGISAIVCFGKADPGRLRHSLDIMHSALAHRGPDGEGFLTIDSTLHPRRFQNFEELALCSDARSAIAFRRLKIQDLGEDAAQPMCSADGQTWIVFNGEIYNFAEIRRELESIGIAVHTRGDTEVALAAYRQWGEACFEKFNGMWAILIFDLARRRLVASRDRLGIKPLFYSIDNGWLLLASEMKALALAKTAGPEIEPYRFQEFLLGFPPQSAELSFFREVHPVPAGTTFTIDLDAPAVDGVVFRRYWDLNDFRHESQPVEYGQAVSKLLELLQSSVELQMAADVPVGCLLSGGLDTSMVARLIAERTSQRAQAPAKAFSLVYDDPEMSELPYIQAVAAQGHLQSCTLTMTPELVWNSVDRVIAAQGQPLLGHDLIAQYHAYGLARECGATVVLEGQGADEMLGGMPYYESPIFMELIAELRVSALIAELRSRAIRYSRSSLSVFRQYVWGTLRRRVSERLRPFTADWLDCELNGGPGRSKDFGNDHSALNRFLYRLVRHTNIPTVLQYQDRSSMAHGVESRVPFLDHRIVEFCFRLPPEYKVALGERKRILREVAKQYLPAAVLDRKDKKVFVSKIDWFPLRHHASALREMANSRTMQQLPWIRPRRMADYVERYLRGGHNDILGVWRLYTAWRWLETTPFGRTQTRMGC